MPSGSGARGLQLRTLSCPWATLRCSGRCCLTLRRARWWPPARAASRSRSRLRWTYALTIAPELHGSTGDDIVDSGVRANAVHGFVNLQALIAVVPAYALCTGIGASFYHAESTRVQRTMQFGYGELVAAKGAHTQPACSPRRCPFEGSQCPPRTRKSGSWAAEGGSLSPTYVVLGAFELYLALDDCAGALPG